MEKRKRRTEMLKMECREAGKEEEKGDEPNTTNNEREIKNTSKRKRASETLKREREKAGKEEGKMGQWGS